MELIWHFIMSSRAGSQEREGGREGDWKDSSEAGNPAALPGDAGSVPSTHMVSQFQGIQCLLGSMVPGAHGIYTPP